VLKSSRLATASRSRPGARWAQRRVILKSRYPSSDVMSLLPRISAPPLILQREGRGVEVLPAPLRRPRSSPGIALHQVVAAGEADGSWSAGRQVLRLRRG
jgi:hypothetical protein